MWGILIKMGLGTAATAVADSYLRSSGAYRAVMNKASRAICELTNHVWEDSSCCEGTNAAGQKVQIQHCQRCPATRESRIRD